jgi:hypothetical protein
VALIDDEVLVAVAATTAVLSPRARRAARKGVVYGLAGVLKAGDVAVAAARGAAQAVQSTSGTSDGDVPQPGGPETGSQARGKSPRQRTAGTGSSS